MMPFVLMPGMHILNVLCFVSWMCTSGTGWVHIKCVHTVPKDVTRGYMLSAFKMRLQVTSRSHLWVHCKCDQTKLGGHIGVTWCQCSQCIPHVPTGYLGHHPQCKEGGSWRFVRFVNFVARNRKESREIAKDSE